MKHLIYIISIILLLFHSKDAKAQGCSDAGFCSIGNIKLNPLDIDSVRYQKINVGVSIGIGDESVIVTTPFIQYENKLNKHWIVQAKITANNASGSLSNTSGLGDVFLTGNYQITSKYKWESNLIGSIKFPLNQSNLSKDGKSLPMQYQSSLGTIDAIIGASITNQNWLFAAAFQQPLSGSNKNEFLPEYWTDESAKKFPPTNSFNRKGDVLGRITYNLKSSSKIKFSGGLLGIIHLGQDTYFNTKVSNNPIKLKGSKGLTLNATLGAWYLINKNIYLGIICGAPLIVREIRPDGLTRSFVFNPEISIKF